MEPAAALKLLDNTLATLSLSRADHTRIADAVAVLNGVVVEHARLRLATLVTADVEPPVLS